MSTVEMVKLDVGCGLAYPTEWDVRAVVGPELAAYFLSKMRQGQRRSTNNRVEGFERLMRSGGFIDDMEPGIWFGLDGTCVNGKHRLTAQVRAGTTHIYRVGFGKSEEKVRALDDLNARRDYQTLNLTGGSMTKSIAAVAKMCMRLEMVEPQHLPSAMQKRFMSQEIQEWHEANRMALDEIKRQIPFPTASASTVAGIVFCYPIAPAQVSSFADTLRLLRRHEYVEARRGHPARALARFLSEKGKGSHYMVTQFSKTINAVRAHVEGRDMLTLRSTEEALRWAKLERTKASNRPSLVSA